MPGTLIVAIIALVLSVSSLTWQIVQFLLAGSRVEAELQMGLLYPAGAILHPALATIDWAQLMSLGSRQVLAVVVRNKGRLGVTVTSWQFMLGDHPYFPAANEGSVDLPYRLEPGAAVQLLYYFDKLSGALNTLGRLGVTQAKILGQAHLGNGRTATTKNASLLNFSAVEQVTGVGTDPPPPPSR